MQNRAAVVAGIVAVVIAVFVVLLATSDTEQTSSANFEILGDVAPEIAGPTLDGGEYSLRAERGKWVVVNFFASWCVGCRVEHPELVEFDRRHQNDGVELIAVMFGDSEQNAQDFFNELGGSWPALVEDTGRVAIDYSVTAVPETILISPSGRVVQKWVGAQGVTADALDAVIEQLSAPPVDSTADAEAN